MSLDFYMTASIRPSMYFADLDVFSLGHETIEVGQ
eukprot:COSAG06_NODE_22043_length_736_cov_1.281005_1_plen_34_part_10